MRWGLPLLQAAFAASARTVRHTLSAQSFSGAAMALSDGREVMQVKKLSDNAIMPVRGSEYAAGFDLASAYETTVPAGRQALIKTDLSIAIPPNTYARIAPRSGLAVKKMIDVGAGVVDYDYRGPVGVVIFNHGSEDFKVNKGDRVAQLILERISMAGIEEVAELSETTRGSGGFGSTGVTHKALETSAVENGPNKHKTSSPLTKSQESQRNMLQLVDEAIETLDLDPDSDLALKLRKQAMGICWLSFGEKMAAIASRYEETGDKKAMLLNLDCID